MLSERVQYHVLENIPQLHDAADVTLLSHSDQLGGGFFGDKKIRADGSGGRSDDADSWGGTARRSRCGPDSLENLMTLGSDLAADPLMTDDTGRKSGRRTP